MQSCDPWHTLGDKNFHSNSISRSFIELCKERFPFNKKIVPIGTTGYPVRTQFNKEDTHWCLDEMGRFHLITGLPNLPAIFQRYSQGDLLMGYSRDWSCLSSDQLDQIKEQLKMQ